MTHLNFIAILKNSLFKKCVAISHNQKQQGEKSWSIIYLMQILLCDYKNNGAFGYRIVKQSEKLWLITVILRLNGARNGFSSNESHGTWASLAAAAASSPTAAFCDERSDWLKSNLQVWNNLKNPLLVLFVTWLTVPIWITVTHQQSSLSLENLQCWVEVLPP